MTDYTGLALVIGAIFTGLTSLGTLLTVYLTAQAKAKQDRIDKEEAKAALEVTAGKLESLAETVDAAQKTGEAAQKTGEAVHTLVNSASLVQLKLYAVAARRIAALTNDQADIEAADAAEKLAKNHEVKQANLDAKES